jgi:peptide/nickel transport system substrate-binding protein
VNRIRTVLIAVALLPTCLFVPARAENVVRWATPTPAESFDPYGHDLPQTYWVQLQVYERLLDYDKDGRLEPRLAESWKALDPTTWELELRRGVTFHDGTPFTSADVAFSFERAKAETSSQVNTLGSIARVETIDVDTVRFTVATSNPIPWDDLSVLPIMSKTWAERHGAALPSQLGDERWDYAETHANGTGPFMVEDFRPGERTVLVRNADWWGLRSTRTTLIGSYRRELPTRLEAPSSSLRATSTSLLSATRPARADRRHTGSENPESRQPADGLPRLRPGECRAQVLKREGAELFR